MDALQISVQAVLIESNVIPYEVLNYSLNTSIYCWSLRYRAAVSFIVFLAVAIDGCNAYGTVPVSKILST